LFVLRKFLFYRINIDEDIKRIRWYTLEKSRGHKTIIKNSILRAKRDKKRKKYTKTTEYFFERYEIKE